MIDEKDVGRRAMQMIAALKDLESPDDVMAILLAGLALMITLTSEDRTEAGDLAKELGLNLIKMVVKDFAEVHARIDQIEELMRATEGTRQ